MSRGGDRALKGALKSSHAKRVPKLSENGKPLGRPPIFPPEEAEERNRASKARCDKKKAANRTPEQIARKKASDARYVAKKILTEEQRLRRNEIARQSKARCATVRSEAEGAAMKAKKKAYMQAYELSPAQKARARETSSRWAQENSDRVAENRAEWAKKNPDSYRVYAQNRRARKRNQAGQISPDIGDRLMQLQRGKCAACRVALTQETRELDHVIPLASGGEHDDGNLQLLCQHCNRSKGTKHPIDFMQSRGKLL